MVIELPTAELLHHKKGHLTSFLNPAIKLLKTMLQMALVQNTVCKGSGKHLAFTVTQRIIDPMKHSN